MSKRALGKLKSARPTAWTHLVRVFPFAYISISIGFGRPGQIAPVLLRASLRVSRFGLACKAGVGSRWVRVEDDL